MGKIDAQERTSPPASNPGALTTAQALDLVAYLKSKYGIEAERGGAIVVTITDHSARASKIADPAIASDIDRLSRHIESLSEAVEDELVRSFQRTLVTLSNDDDDLDRPL